MPTSTSSSSWSERLGGSAHYKWILLLVLSVIAAVNYADRGVLNVMFPLLRHDLGMSDLGLAGIGTAFLWSYAVASPFAGTIADRRSRRTVILGCLAAWSVVTVLTSFAATGSQLLFMRALLGICEALYIPASTALIAEFHDSRTRALALSVHAGGMSAGGMLGGAYGGFVGEHCGWRLAVLGLGAFGLLVAALGVRLIVARRPTSPTTPAPAAVTESPFAGVVAILRTPLCALMIGQAMLISVGSWIIAQWLPLYFKEVFGLSLGAAGLAGTAASNAGAVLGVLYGGWLSDRVARRGWIGRLRLQILCYVAAIPFLFILLGAGNINVASFSIVAFIIMRSIGSAGEVALLCEPLPSHRWSTAAGLLNTANCMAGGLAILISGILKARYGLNVIFVGSSLFIGLAALGLIIGWLAARRRADRDTRWA